MVAQDNSVQGEFQVDFRRGCNPHTVQITNNLSVPGAVTVYWYKGIDSRNEEDTSTVYTYDETGEFVLYQITRTGASITNIDSITIEVFDAPDPEFELYRCNGNAAVVLLTDNYYDQFEIDYDIADPTNPIFTVARGQTVPTYTYAGSGTYNVSVKGQFIGAADNCAERVASIDAITTLPTGQIDELRVHNDTDATVQFNLAPNIRYQLEVAINGSSNFQTVSLIDNSTDFYSLTGLENESSVYCFRISTLDICSATITSSPPICTVQSAVVAENNQNRISWATIDAGISSFSIIRDGAILVSVSSSQRQYLDTFVECETEYCYEVQANYTSGVSVSMDQCVTAFSSDQPVAIENSTISVDQEDIQIVFTEPPGFTPSFYSLFRSVNEGSFQFLDSVQSRTYIDPNLNTAEDLHCYQISYRDVCGNFSTPSEACAILLEARLDALQNAQLSWNEYTGWENGVSSYIVDIIDQSGAILTSVNVGTATSFSMPYQDFPAQSVQFRVTAETISAGVGNAVSNVVSLTVKPRISFPGAFSPNGDGLNEVWQIEAQFYVDQLEVRIYNRWGEQIFYSDAIDNGWDGTFRGELVKAGAYTYRIDYIDTLGRPFKRSGNITLLR